MKSNRNLNWISDDGSEEELNKANAKLKKVILWTGSIDIGDESENVLPINLSSDSDFGTTTYYFGNSADTLLMLNSTLRMSKTSTITGITKIDAQTSQLIEYKTGFICLSVVYTIAENKIKLSGKIITGDNAGLKFPNGTFTINEIFKIVPKNS